MNIQMIFPSDVLHPHKVAHEYETEYLAALEAGMACALVDIDTMVVKGQLVKGVEVAYRGWMLTLSQYHALSEAVSKCEATLMTSLRDYASCHHMPGWYEKCKELTPETLFFQEDQFDLILTCLRDHAWTSCFVKDYVKSLTTSRGSRADNITEVYEIIALLRQYRGELEGGLCLREFEELEPNSERRYFVYQGEVYGAEGFVPKIVELVANRVDCPFYSVDIARNIRGDYRLIEIGDGQVSDLKDWPIDKFLMIFNSSTTIW